MVDKLEEFKWYISNVYFNDAQRLTFFLDAAPSSYGYEVDDTYNSISFAVKNNGTMEYLGFTSNNSLNNKIWDEAQLPSNFPSVFYEWMFIDIFSDS